jgi:hypothetical protein
MQTLYRTKLAFALPALFAAVSCSGADGSADVLQAGRAPDPDGRLFTLMPSSFTGVRFENRVRESQERNVFTYRNFYNGGGVGLGDLTGDGLPEIVLTSNQEGARLYVNTGGFRFRDVTKASGLKADAESWTTGVALADVNGDGRLDIYLCRAGPFPADRRANELWIHQGVGEDGVPSFREMAREYGVADEGYSIQGAFLDFDRDGDLDLFVINNSPRPASSFGVRNTRHVRDANGGARLYRNDGKRFTDVSAAAGIYSPEIAFGLGLGVGDVNRDGWPDVYVANDFFERDYLYVNNQNGTFAEALDQQMPVISYFSMGMDIGDIDNDGWPDIYTTDMLPEDEYRLKTTTMFEGWDVYRRKVENGYHHQLMRNMLQRNNRDGTFSDIGEMAGVARTDWSWSALIADLDLDGFKDIYVTNGLAKDITSQDYVAFLANAETMKAVTSGGTRRVDFERLTKAMTSTPLSDYAFRNQGAARFSNEAKSWGLDAPNISNGAAYGDLDGDGALDLVVNNVNQEAFVYRNNARAISPGNHFLRVHLDGDGGNRFGVGARVTLFASDADGGKGDPLIAMQELWPSRGFQSSVDYVLVFGLGAHPIVDSLRIEWPDGRVGRQRSVAANQLVSARQSEAEAEQVAAVRRPPPIFAPASVSLPFIHRENEFNDFNRERLIPKMLSTEGPFMDVADVNGDGLQDAFVGGAKDQPGHLLLQQSDGRFVRGSEDAFEQDRISEDLGSVFFDANGDGAPDLYVVSGGSEYSDRAPALQDRLYLNDGRGNFRKATGALPAEFASGSRVRAADYDGDGDIDLFVGGRVVPWRYGMMAESMVLANDGRGNFTNVTRRLAPALERVGMVTDAVWQDVDGDRQLDLVVVGEWMPITVFRNTGGGKLTPHVPRGLEKSAGWWNRIVARDFTGDGRVDFVVGNLGLNSRLRATASAPTSMYVKDFDGNGSVEQIVASFNGDASYPIALRDDLLKGLPYLAPAFPTYKDYALKTVEDIFSPKELGDAVTLRAHTFASSLVRLNADGSYTLVPLPAEAQITPIYGILADDIDGDKNLDLLLVGNFDSFKPEIGRMAASFGLALRGDGKGHFAAMPSGESGFKVAGQGRDIRRLQTRAGDVYVVTRNNDAPMVFRRDH